MENIYIGRILIFVVAFIILILIPAAVFIVRGIVYADKNVRAFAMQAIKKATILGTVFGGVFGICLIMIVAMAGDRLSFWNGLLILLAVAAPFGLIIGPLIAAASWGKGTSVLYPCPACGFTMAKGKNATLMRCESCKRIACSQCCAMEKCSACGQSMTNLSDIAGAGHVVLNLHSSFGNRSDSDRIAEADDPGATGGITTQRAGSSPESE